VIRLLLDQGLPRSSVRHLQEAGIDVEHVADIGFDRASDTTILEQARKRGRVIVTLDADFHRLLAVSGESAPSVIRIRREGLRGPEVAVLIQQVLTQVGEQLPQGVMVTVTERHVRLHHLPLRRASSKVGESPP
jgi:predicted nuclease of predicted toxin-antitoxin system